ncbi:CapA family protein [Polyangium sp. 15x6]|uniref:CapA family protein n=1 Tax=Polyangium sp. 15x6 TaxID=3042687 RepID=UPI00249A1684|nr:CapA family protein [Polyangium sp. 15x6]MDI3289926.1 CapA family protein [Polyangium sp. 15x6]
MHQAAPWMELRGPSHSLPGDLLTLFLCGDVMTGRGIDQVLPHPSEPTLFEPYVRDARDYVTMAEETNGPIQRPIAFSSIWGDALSELERVAPAARIINLETSVTRSDTYWEGKGINYRMHPENTPCLAAFGIDVCILANNHVLDFGASGLLETLTTLKQAGLRIAGAGEHLSAARAPAVLPLGGARRLHVFAFGTASSGIPASWAATDDSPGVDRLADLSEATALEIRDRVRHVKRAGDVVVASIHWGSNWGYDVPEEHVRFAHALIEGGIDLVHGHSSHHVRPIEVYRNKLILYGCGDFLNDYEGIAGHASFRGDLALMYFPVVDPSTGELASLRMTPMQIRGFRLHHVGRSAALWLRDTLHRISRGFGAQVDLDQGSALVLRWR